MDVKLLRDYLLAVRSQKFVPTKAAIEDITSSGKLENLKNQDLKNAILNYYVDQDYRLEIIRGNDEQLSQKVFAYSDYTDFGMQELPLYQHIYGEELKQLLKSTDWQKDSKGEHFKQFRDHMNITLIICEREQDLLGGIKASAISVKNLVDPLCK